MSVDPRPFLVAGDKQETDKLARVLKCRAGDEGEVWEVTRHPGDTCWQGRGRLEKWGRGRVGGIVTEEGQ